MKSLYQNIFITTVLLVAGNCSATESLRDIAVHGNLTVTNEWDQSLLFIYNNQEKGRISPNYNDGEKGITLTIDQGATHNLRINNDGTIAIPNSLIIGYNTLVADPLNNKVNINNPQNTSESLNVNGGAAFSGGATIARSVTVGDNTLIVNTDWQRVGINTATPNSSLDVKGDTEISQNLRFNSANTPLNAIGGAEEKLQIIRGTLDTSYGGTFGQYVYGFTAQLGDKPGEVIITFDTPYNQYEIPAVCVTCGHNDNDIVYIGAVKNVTSTGFTLETYDLRSMHVGCIAHFIAIGTIPNK